MQGEIENLLGNTDLETQEQQKDISWVVCYEEFPLTNAQSKDKHIFLMILTGKLLENWKIINISIATGISCLTSSVLSYFIFIGWKKKLISTTENLQVHVFGYLKQKKLVLLLHT